MSWRRKLHEVVSKQNEIQNQLADINIDGKQAGLLSQELGKISELAELAKIFLDREQTISETKELLEDEDAELRKMAQEDLETLKAMQEEAEDKLKRLLLPKDEAHDRGVVLEIRAGTGGDEAALFAYNLYRMYAGYAERRNWLIDMIEYQETDLEGISRAIFSIKGKGAYGLLRFESGVHRVQRVPETESSGRIHTSAATVAVLPEAEETDINIVESDLRVDTFRAQGAGGQHVNTTDSAVRITHLPTGVVVTCQDEKSQHKNRAKAMTVLRSRIYEIERERLEQERAQSRKEQVGSGDRSQRIRTYNYPQGRITDHRISLTLYKLATVISGEDLNDIIMPLIQNEELEKISQWSEE